jgi:SAM-dependent methyltransferase
MTKNVDSFDGVWPVSDFPQMDPSLVEPFGAGRNAGRLLFDFGLMVSLLNENLMGRPLLDFGAGTGWVSEFFVRLGIPTVSFDIHQDLESCISNRINADERLDASIWKFRQGDGHQMPFENDTFGHMCCYDTLHHMHTYSLVFEEFFRVLSPGGRAIFVEQGARHSKSPETIAFLESQKKLDPSWIERDVVLDELDVIAKGAGFTSGINVVPTPHPLALQEYSMQEWNSFRKGDKNLREQLANNLSKLNYDERVIFFVEKPE